MSVERFCLDYSQGEGWGLDVVCGAKPGNDESEIYLVRASDYDALSARCAALEQDAAKDQRRLLFLLELADVIGEIDLHERAFDYAEKRGVFDQAEDCDYLSAIRDAVDAAMRDGK